MNSCVSAMDGQLVNPVVMASLISHQHDLVAANTLFERLVSGQQTELGETPPAYEAASSGSVPPACVGIA
jgi:hypothetical protein